MASVIPQSQTRSSDEQTMVTAEEERQALLGVLDDADCRDILEVTSKDALSASEIAENCTLPLSTTYRKINMLTEVGLLEEGTRIRRTGKHTSEYVHRIDDIVISINANGGLELSVTR